MRREYSLLSYSVIWITIINVAIYVVQLSPYGMQFTDLFSLTPAQIVEKKFVWQVFTYQFLHDPNVFLHIFFNMFSLVMFGPPVEEQMGSRRFVFFYLLCGTVAGALIFLISLITGGFSYEVHTLGASGAVFGIFVAFAYFYPEARILVFFVFPVKAKYLVVFYATFELYMEVTGGQANVSHLGHLGGIACAVLYLLLIRFRVKRRRFKGTANKNKIQKIYTKVREIVETVDPSLEMKKNILNKLSGGGTKDSLTEDEWQFVKQLDILIDENSINQTMIHRNDTQAMTDAQFITQVRRFISFK